MTQLDGLGEDTILDHAPDELIAEAYRRRFAELVRHHAQELLDEMDQAPGTGFEADPEMAQRRVIRGASYRAFRQLWSERKEETQ